MGDTPNNAAQGTPEAGGGQNADGNGAGTPPDNGTPTTPPAGDNATPPAGDAQPPAGDAKWFAGLPETMHEHLDGFADEAEAMAALARGKEFVAPTSADEVKITLPEGQPFNEDVVNRFKQVCVDLGIPGTIAQGLMDWQIKDTQEGMKAYMEAGEKDLKGRWGANYDANREQGLVALTVLDRHMGGRLSTHLGATGLANDPMIVEVLHTISGLISEDSLDRGTPGGSTKPQTAEEAYNGLYAKAKTP